MKASDRILLGLYRFKPELNIELPIDTAELAWLYENGATHWVCKKGRKKKQYSADKGRNESYLDPPLRDLAKIKKALSALAAKGLVSFTAPTGFGFQFQVKLLADGLLRAESLDSLFGRIEVWYADNKNGALGLLLTIVVAALTSFITNIISNDFSTMGNNPAQELTAHGPDEDKANIDQKKAAPTIIHDTK